jgi:hypothetical protein
LDFFEEDCVEEVRGWGVAEEEGEFGGFGGGGGGGAEDVEPAVKGFGGGAAVVEEEVEEGWVGVVDGWTGLVWDGGGVEGVTYL